MVQANFSDKAKRDYRLVQKAVNENDEKAYAKLMGLYRDSIYFMLLKMVSNKDDAEDLTIEAFGKAFMRLHQYTPTYAFSTWLFRIASNNCIDFLRKKRMKLLSIDDDDDDSPTIDLKSSSLNPEQQTIKDQKHLVMHEIVGKLKPRYKILIQLRYFDELSYEEISQELDMPLGTVKAQLFRAREVLQGILKPRIDNF